MRSRRTEKRAEKDELPVNADRLTRIYEFLISTPEINSAWNAWVADHPLPDDVPTRIE